MKRIVLILLPIIMASGCIHLQSTDGAKEPGLMSSTSVEVSAEILKIKTSNVSGSSPVSEERTVSPKDTALIKIDKIKSVDQGEFDIDISEGHEVRVDLHYGARPAKIVNIPGPDYRDRGNKTTASATSEWSEWQNDTFIFKQRKSTIDEKTVVDDLEGLESSNIVETKLVFNREKTPLMSKYTVIGK